LQALQAALGHEKDLDLRHLRTFGCRAYALRYKISRTQKTELRAHIGYLVEYDSTNIFRIWIPSKKRVISTRDVTFKEDLFYNPKKLDMLYQLRKGIEEIIEIFEFSQIRQQQEDTENIEQSSDTDSNIDSISDIEEEYEDLH
jgi:hypothetical protein